MTRTIRRPLVAAMVGLLALTACADDGNDADGAAGLDAAAEVDAPAPAPAGEDAMPTQEADGFPLTFTSSAGEWTLDAMPERIVSLSPTATEMLFAVGAGDQRPSSSRTSSTSPASSMA